MSEILCPRCGTTIPADAAFCGHCGAALASQQPAPPADNVPAPDWQPPVATQPQQPAAYPPPASYPPPGAAQPMGNNTKWAIGLGIASLFCCGPFTAIPGFFLAKKDMDDIAAGRAPQINESSAKIAFYLNIAALILFVLGVCVFWGRLGMLRRF